jgi:hypothetical protein
MSTIPNELKINVKTSVPGKQLFRLEPSMILKNESSKDSTIQFNPLIKLKQQIVNKVPEYLRKKQFVDKGLFESLINLTNATPSKNLQDAIQNGNIDNNIGITLNTLMPQETVITIGGRPYVIVDLQWTKGSWKVDTKKKPPQYDSNKITDPAFFNAVITDEIIKGESQLVNLPKSAVYGENYTGPKDVPVSLSSVLGYGLSGTPPGGPPGGPHLTSTALVPTQLVPTQLVPTQLVPTPLTAADIAAAVAAAVAALPANKAPPTAKEIADAIVASFGTLAANAFRYTSGSGFTTRVFIEEVTDAVRAALPPPPVYPAIAPPPTAAEIANAIRAAILALPAPVVNVAHPALPPPPVYPALMPPSAKGIKQILNYYLPNGVASGTRTNISKAIVSSMLPAYSSRTPQPISGNAYDSDSDSDNDSSSGPPPSKPSKPPKRQVAAAMPTMTQINTDIVLGQTARQTPTQIANVLIGKNVTADIINIFFTIKNLPIPSNIKDENVIQQAKNINKFIQQNLKIKSKNDIISELLTSGYDVDRVEAVYAARSDEIGNIVQKKAFSQPLFQPDAADMIPEDFTRLKSHNNSFVKSVFINRGTLRDGIAVVYKHNPTNFYTMLNYVYANCNDSSRDLLRRFLKNSTTINASELDIKIRGSNKGQQRSTLSEAAYTESVQGLDVILNRGGGDCLFIAAAQAINYYNLYSQDEEQRNRITTQDGFGTGNKSFTQEKLREITAEFFQTWREIDHRLELARITAEDLNAAFANAIAEEQSVIQIQISLGNNSVTEITPKSYRKLIEDVYIHNENFLTESIYLLDPTIAIPPPTTTDYRRPFRPITRKENIRAYVESPFYWAGPEAIIAISNVLKLQIIPIQIAINQTNKNVEMQSVHTNFDEGDNQWDKYLFLYFDPTQKHYELMTFTDYSSGAKKRITIFDRRENAIVPPLYILFTIYGIFYSSITDQSSKDNFTFRKALMIIINVAIQNLQSTDPAQYRLFYTMFKNIFPTTRLQPITSSGGSYQLGGYPPYGRPQYGRPPYVSSIVRPLQYVENSQLSYYITIELQLHPGTTLSPEDRKGLKCNHNWNNVKKSYAQFLGKQYNITPDYSLLAPFPNQSNKSKLKTSQNQYSRPIRRPINQNNTRAYRRGGKTKKYIKKHKPKKTLKKH